MPKRRNPAQNKTKNTTTSRERARRQNALRALSFDTAKDQPWRDRKPTQAQLSLLKRIEAHATDRSAGP